MIAAIVALAAALAAGHLVAAFVGPQASPLLAVGNTAIDLTPSWLKDFAIATFGTADKLALLVGMGGVLLGLAVLAALASGRGPAPGTVLIVAVGVLGLVAVVTRPDVGRLAAAAPLASLAAGVATWLLLHRRASPSDVVETAGTRPDRAGPDRTDSGAERTDEVPHGTRASGATPGRRQFLVTAGGAAAVAGVAGLAGGFVGGARDATSSRAAAPPLRATRRLPAPPNDADFAKLGTPTFLTPNDAFYRIDTALSVPQVPADDWRLRIHGMVDRELELSYDDVRRRGLIERRITLCCVSNQVGGELISTATFTGVDLGDLLRDAGVRDGAQQLLSSSSDGWTCGTPIDVLLERDRGAMLALGMNGQPLPLEHGFPARLVVPGLYGYVSATKWVTDLEVTTWDRRRAYWLDRGWAREAPVKTQSRIDRPSANATMPAGRVIAAGIAWAQHTGVAKVEVRLDGGRWQEATLSADVSDDTWRMWHIALDVDRPGSHRIACRATDKSGYTQTAERMGVLPDGATGHHTITFTTE
ncbi:DMSO/TMAO reductase YedYZ, molybdopterin-dependent catalytic subunit [Prauserella alba]|uniref:Molybdopterin-dependent oxidoreductase n=1 Tax=Prauserella alba TaxID=176898 RepID=A0ABP4G1B5_9PSEU|nr:DMSO/TMAO reductase YedYZ, molybdopterin-dependent catalytic subunit [Prauserella alba]